MSDETGSELAELRDTVHAGFARMDRYFELQQAQFLGLDARVHSLDARVQSLDARVEALSGDVRELRGMLVALIARVDRIELRLTRLEESVQRLDGEVRSLRDWATREFADVRSELRLIRREAAERDAAVRRDVDALSARVDRLESRLQSDS
jgi:chromosome segregation ATPase